ncbi:hypothetical protein EYB53_012380 [Candidatus Chloroploca sp. M-50]|uniref:Uncharacterized protein n=1 Tax=Candidatus Chloroploca mongolica TaxID=2528176 RepID=A0ABS4DAP4_9CHLR|nr:hypothetical protein [Candidatus Chloroploca mongolica]MBP1466503.1 hypothetical protein [Candidatus Chloroploca mongolica]
MRPRSTATIEDLYHLPENAKAELVDGEIAEAEPAVPHWRMAVNDLFPDPKNPFILPA